MNVLSVHRRSVTRTEVGMILTRAGHAVTTANSDDRLLDRMRAGSYDAAVISDDQQQKFVVVVSNSGLLFTNLINLGKELPIAMSVIANEVHGKAMLETCPA